MPTFVMLTRLSPDAVQSPGGLPVLERDVTRRIEAECPEVEWVASYAILGPCDYLDVFRAPDVECATKVSLLVRTGGHATTEVWTATEWSRFKELIKGIREAA